MAARSGSSLVVRTSMIKEMIVTGDTEYSEEVFLPKSRQKTKGVITSTNGPRGDTTVDICTRWKKIKLSQGT